MIKQIETREGLLRRNIRFPEREIHSAPVELVCQIGDRLFAFEHTSIEPFEQHIELEAKAPKHFQPIQDQLIGFLPTTEHFILQVPAKATLNLRPREIERIQSALVDWIKQEAYLLPVVRLPGFIVPLRYHSVPGVPFEVFLIRSVRGGRPGQLSVTHLVERNNFEEARLERIRRAYQAKIPKLSAWQKFGARTVLIFEENDRQLTNHHLVAEAIHKIEADTEQRSDEIYLVSSAINAFWSLWSIQIDHHIFDDLSLHGTALTSNIDPRTLENLTGR